MSTQGAWDSLHLPLPSLLLFQPIDCNRPVIPSLSCLRDGIQNHGKFTTPGILPCCKTRFARVFVSTNKLIDLMKHQLTKVQTEDQSVGIVEAGKQARRLSLRCLTLRLFFQLIKPPRCANAVSGRRQHEASQAQTSVHTWTGGVVLRLCLGRRVGRARGGN